MVNQMAVFIENRKGRILELTKILKKNGIDLITLTVADTKDFGILRCIARDNEKAEKVLRDAGFTVKASSLVGIEVDDKAGALADALQFMDDNGINIEYTYAYSNLATKRAVILFKVADEKMTEEILAKNNIRLIDNSLI